MESTRISYCKECTVMDDAVMAGEDCINCGNGEKKPAILLVFDNVEEAKAMENAMRQRLGIETKEHIF